MNKRAKHVVLGDLRGEKYCKISMKGFLRSGLSFTQTSLKGSLEIQVQRGRVRCSDLSGALDCSVGDDLRAEAGNQHLERKFWQQVGGWLLHKSKQGMTVAHVCRILPLGASKGQGFAMDRNQVDSAG